jgi:YHS domain-containing protein
MIDFNRNCASTNRPASKPRRPKIRLATIPLVIAGFWLSHGKTVLAAGHGEEEHAPAKPADAKPPEPPPPPRPTEYPRGLSEKPKPGESAAKPAAQKPGDHTSVPDPHANAHDAPPAPDPHAASSEAPKMQAQPQDVGKPAENATPVPHEGDARSAQPDPAAALKAWTPPKRYHFVTDIYTGLAMGGADPVQIYVNGQVQQGLREHELDWGGATWHFTNEGNMAAFQHDPEVYAPKFGGRCAYALSQGLLVEAQPNFYIIYHEHLYFFANAANRAAFLTNPDAFAQEAERQWPILSRGEP